MRTRLLSTLLFAFVVGCATPSQAPHPGKVPHYQYGAWVEIETFGGMFEGELLAVDREHVYLQLEGFSQIARIPKSAMVRFRGYRFQSSWGAFAVWGVLGTAATISHGWFLVATAPYWLFTSVAAPIKVWQRSLLENPDSGWSRYPQGLPESLRDRVVEPPTGYSPNTIR